MISWAWGEIVRPFAGGALDDGFSGAGGAADLVAAAALAAGGLAAAGVAAVLAVGCFDSPVLLGVVFRAEPLAFFAGAFVEGFAPATVLFASFFAEAEVPAAVFFCAVDSPAFFFVVIQRPPERPLHARGKPP
ncbi:MAG: hypothetical protein H5U40_00535 [Polyangiaceae bacterium]|nr:hypothetical protein [Polyangiaceae bacterium]